MTVYGRGLRGLAIATVLIISVAFALVFFYAPLDADQGFVQKIFYVHVPLAITALCGFVFGGVLGAMYLRTGDRKWDIRSYVAIHMALIFGVGTLITGSIWAKASWGHWWIWSDPTLTSFLIVMLLFATYQPLRFSIEDPERQSRYASVFAVVAGAFVPLNFIAVRAAQGYVHPRVLTLTGGNLPGSMRLTFLVALLGIGLLYATLWKFEMAAKSDPDAGARTAAHAAGGRSGDALEAERCPVMSALVVAVAPALPLHTAGKYVAGAYIVFLALVLVYVAIMATRLARTERELSELRHDLELRRQSEEAGDQDRQPERVA